MSIRRKAGLIKLIGLVGMFIGLFCIGSAIMRDGFAKAERDATGLNSQDQKRSQAEKLSGCAQNRESTPGDQGSGTYCGAGTIQVGNDMETGKSWGIQGWKHRKSCFPRWSLQQNNR